MRHPGYRISVRLVPEIVEDGVTGFIVTDEIDAVAAVKRASSLDRRTIRKRFEERSSVSLMVEDYVKLYKSSPRPR
jgi:hypothetical protein